MVTRKTKSQYKYVDVALVELVGFVLSEDIKVAGARGGSAAQRRPSAFLSFLATPKRAGHSLGAELAGDKAGEVWGLRRHLHRF